MKIVIDTNVLISAMYFGGNPRNYDLSKSRYCHWKMPVRVYFPAMLNCYYLWSSY